MPSRTLVKPSSAEASEPIPEGVKIRIVNIGPHEAQQLILKNPHNRNINPETVHLLARQMLKGQWEFAGDPIRVDHDGNLQDGQHRMEAVKECGLTLPFILIEGLDPKVQYVIDQGRKRGVGDQLMIEGWPNAYATAATARLVMAWDLGQLTSNRARLSRPEVLDFCFANQDDLQHSTQQGLRFYYQTRTPASAGAALYFKASQVDVEAAEVFWDHLVHGHDLPLRSPILLARRLCNGINSGDERPHRSQSIYYMAKAWEAWRKNIDMRKMPLPERGLTMSSIPEIV